MEIFRPADAGVELVLGFGFVCAGSHTIAEQRSAVNKNRLI